MKQTLEMLAGKICIVTGAGQGIGRAIAELFAQEGAIVYANDVVPACMDEWAKRFDASGRIRPLYFDITDPSQVREAFAGIWKENKRLDVLVNNAGIEFNERIGMISDENIKRMLEVNVVGTIQMLQMAARLMEKGDKGGSIVNIASMVGLRGNAGQLVYSATKGAVVALTKSAAKELASKNIRVNAIAPGLTNTHMMQAADEAKLQRRIDNICLGRIAEPLDIAKACLFLASDLAGYVSGHILCVDGCTIM